MRPRPWLRGRRRGAFTGLDRTTPGRTNSLPAPEGLVLIARVPDARLHQSPARGAKVRRQQRTAARLPRQRNCRPSRASPSRALRRRAAPAANHCRPVRSCRKRRRSVIHTQQKTRLHTRLNYKAENATTSSQRPFMALLLPRERSKMIPRKPRQRMALRGDSDLRSGTS